ncbi:MAG: hypothetical protein JWQ16_2828 [Novosphingobium sp.]|nr:hypothetical protein [Novosphingobium sp.]
MRNGLKPLHAILLAFPVVLFVSAVLADAAFLKTAQMQWSNFSAWLIAGGLVLGGVVILWALVEVVRARSRRQPLIYLLILAVMWVIGFLNELLHSRDAWYSVTATGLLLSVITAALALAAGWIGFRGISHEEVR